MTLIVNCRDIGFDCEGVIRAESPEEVLRLVAKHAKDDHGMDEVPAELVAKVQAVMLEE